MGSRHGVTVRKYIWLRRIELPAGGGQSAEATCLVAPEFDEPSGVKPIELRLLINRKATTLPEAIELIDRYRARWKIETLLNALKNGCRVEARQLGSNARRRCFWSWLGESSS